MHVSASHVPRRRGPRRRSRWRRRGCWLSAAGLASITSASWYVGAAVRRLAGRIHHNRHQTAVRSTTDRQSRMAPLPSRTTSRKRVRSRSRLAGPAAPRREVPVLSGGLKASAGRRRTSRSRAPSAGPGASAPPGCARRQVVHESTAMPASWSPRRGRRRVADGTGAGPWKATRSARSVRGLGHGLGDRGRAALGQTSVGAVQLGQGRENVAAAGRARRQVDVSSRAKNSQRTRPRPASPPRRRGQLIVHGIGTGASRQHRWSRMTVKRGRRRRRRSHR